MNKTVTINISGIIFHIEEDAFEKLSKYLNTIRGYFKDTDGRDEIMSDIEARIAEMLREKTSAIKQVVLMSDVDQVMEAMGKPEDFAGDGEQQQKKEEEPQPETTTSTKSNRRRRVFRDPDSKIVGGVCSGISHYFDIDPLWLRLAWAVAILIGGFGFLIYIILWIILPKAVTTAEKLEMRGEEVTIENIKRNFQEEKDLLKSRYKDFEKEAKEFGNSFKKGGENRNGAERFGDFMKDVFGGAFRIIAKIFAFLLIIVCASLIIALIGSMFGFGMINNISLNHVSGMIFTSTGQSDLAMTGLLLAAGVPLLMLIYAAVRTLFHIKEKNKIVGYTSTGLWLTGVFILLYVGYGITSDFSEEGRSHTNVQITQPRCDTFFLRMAKNDKLDLEDNGRWHRGGDWDMITEDGDKVLMCYPALRILQSEDDSFHLSVTYYARGANNKDAQVRARKIKYDVIQKDSILEFPAAFEVDKNDKWRAQDVRVILYMPKNKMVFLNHNMKRILNNVDNVTDTWDGDMVNRRWIMTDAGLTCVDCEGLDNSKHHSKRTIQIGDGEWEVKKKK